MLPSQPHLQRTSSEESLLTSKIRAAFNMREEQKITLLCSSPTQHEILNSQRDKQKQRQNSLMQSLLVLGKRFLLVVVALVLCIFLPTASASPVFVDNPSLAQFQSGRNIRHLPCIVRKSGRSGVCMFAIDCIKQNGTHLGTCIDRFYFGSCCQMRESPAVYAPEISDNSIDQNTISHFVHESTTLPTSALFKVTTEGPKANTSQAVNSGISRNTTHTISILATTAPSSVPRSPPTAITTISFSSSSLRPTAFTTPHKHSQFVVRTTSRPKPQIMGKPTIEPTTIKPPKRKTTTRPLLLTTAAPTTLSPAPEELTTPPQKFFTFQLVETTTASATEPSSSNDDETLITTQRPAQPTGVSLVTKSTVRPTADWTKPPPALYRPAATQKPMQTKRPAVTPTLKPASTEPALAQKSTSAPGRRPSPALGETPITTNTIEVRTTLTPLTTSSTKAPRPKPKPTAEIVKVPRPTAGVTATTARPAPTTTTIKTSTLATSTVEVGQNKPQTTAQTEVQFNSTARPTSSSRPAATATSTTPEQSPSEKPLAITTTTTAGTTTTNEKPLLGVSSTTSSTSTGSSTTTPTTTTSMSTTPTLTTTEAANLSEPVLQTTQKPGLVTWTNIIAEPLSNSTTDEEWQPRPPPEEWVPLVTIAPETHVNRTTAAPIIEAQENSSTQKIIVSISSSISEITNNASVSIEQGSNLTDSSRPIATTTIQPTSPTTPLTTESPSDVLGSSNTTESMLSNATGSISQNTENGSSSTTTEYATSEDYNGTLSSTTSAPINTLEGVDYKQVCGRRMFPEPRVVGGSNSAFGRWPWQISLRQWRTSTYLHKCGAALLNENWAITAAHCVDNVPPSDLLLRLGEYDLAEEEEPYGYQERRVQIVASHPQFDPRTFEYDLALLRFYEPIVFQPNIIPVCVPDNNFDFIGQTAFVTGWGRLYEDGPLPSVLQEVAVPIINNSICETMYRAAGYIEHIPHIFICAGWKKGGYDSCEGDSGGPMVLQREADKRFQLGGVISWGIGCAEPNQPGVYTRISEFRDWINQILQF